MPHTKLHENALVVRRNALGNVNIEVDSTYEDAVDSQVMLTPELTRPDSCLVWSLGVCLTEFTARFMRRRLYLPSCSALLRWIVDYGPCCRIVSIDVQLGVAVSLVDADRNTLSLMLEQCPIHKAIHDNVQVVIEITPR
jgi:hypothetical protein